MKLLVNRSFTLIEILIVCTIILVIIGISLSVYNLVVNRVNEAKTESLVKQINAAMQAYRMDQGYYFSNTNSYIDISQKGGVNTDNYFYFYSTDVDFIKLFDFESLKSHGYIKSNGTEYYFVDSWGVPLLYKSPGYFNSKMFDLGSVGKDGMYGDNSTLPANYGKGDDITNFNF